MIVKGKRYIWKPKVLLKNLGKVAIIVFFIVSYLILSNMDYQN